MNGETKTLDELLELELGSKQTSDGKITSGHLGQLLISGLSNGWTRKEVHDYVCDAFGLSPGTIKHVMTLQMWQQAMEHVSNPANKPIPNDLQKSDGTAPSTPDELLVKPKADAQLVSLAQICNLLDHAIIYGASSEDLWNWLSQEFPASTSKGFTGLNQQQYRLALNFFGGSPTDESVTRSSPGNGLTNYDRAILRRHDVEFLVRTEMVSTHNEILTELKGLRQAIESMAESLKEFSTPLGTLAQSWTSVR